MKTLTYARKINDEDYILEEKKIDDQTYDDFYRFIKKATKIWRETGKISGYKGEIRSEYHARAIIENQLKKAVFNPTPSEEENELLFEALEESHKRMFDGLLEIAKDGVIKISNQDALVITKK